MTCPSCGRTWAWSSRRCRTCQTKFLPWYLLAGLLLLLGCFGGFLILEVIL